MYLGPCFDCRITRFIRLFTASYSQVFYPCTINFDVPRLILQGNTFGAPLSPFAPIFRGAMASEYAEKCLAKSLEGCGHGSQGIKADRGIFHLW